MGRYVCLKEFGEVWRCKVMEGLKCEKENLVVDAEKDRKQVKLFEDRSDVLCGWRSGNE